ncbi:thioredoxin [Bellilinea caldifistulae]|nr:thioredoxin domain-containing protein [Bellilinea caldifistulae]GAP11560.1 thioredoxin [Bellilinea caldifistulae]
MIPLVEVEEMRMKEIETISEEEFEQRVLGTEKPVLVEFGAVWCGPCKRLEPELARLSQEWGDRLEILSVDVDEASDLAMQFMVLSVPTLILFQNGEAVKRMSGFQPLQRLKETLEPYLVVHPQD